MTTVTTPLAALIPSYLVILVTNEFTRYPAKRVVPEILGLEASNKLLYFALVFPPVF
jgi:hypothetical protein